MTNEEYFNYFTEKDEIIIENENIKETNYFLVSVLILTSVALLLKFIEEQKRKEQLKLLFK